MKKIILIMMGIITFSLSAGTTAIECTTIKQTFDDFFRKECVIELQKYKVSLNVDGIDDNDTMVVDYEEKEYKDFNITINDGKANFDVEPNRIFTLKKGSFTSVRFRYFVTNSSQYLQYYYTETKRFRKYNNATIKVKEIAYTTRIMLENGTPAKDTKVEAVSGNITYTDTTNENGQVFLSVPVGKEFILRAWNPQENPPMWSVYQNMLKIGEDDKMYQDINGTWSLFDKDFVVQDMNSNEFIQLITFKKGYGSNNINSIKSDNTTVILTGDKRISIIATYPFKKGVKYKFNFDVKENTASDKGFSILLRNSLTGEKYQKISQGEFIPNEDYSQIQLWNSNASTSQFKWDIENIRLVKYKFPKTDIDTHEAGLKQVSIRMGSIVGTEFRIVTESKTYKAIADKNGTAIMWIKEDEPFTIEVSHNYAGIPQVWSSYKNKFKLTKQGIVKQCILDLLIPMTNKDIFINAMK